MAGWDFSIDGLVTGVQSLVKPTGAYSVDSRSVTPSVGNTIVGATVSKPASIWDVLGNAGSAILDNELVQRYVDGKITKELLNDGVPLYTTYGNPSDQAGGKLLQDVAVAEQNAQRTYMLVGLGLVGLIGVALIVARR
jgi:hypothetical protein